MCIHFEQPDIRHDSKNGFFWIIIGPYNSQSSVELSAAIAIVPIEDHTLDAVPEFTNFLLCIQNSRDSESIFYYVFINTNFYMVTSKNVTR